MSAGCVLFNMAKSRLKGRDRMILILLISTQKFHLTFIKFSISILVTQRKFMNCIILTLCLINTYLVHFYYVKRIAFYRDGNNLLIVSTNYILRWSKNNECLTKN